MRTLKTGTAAAFLVCVFWGLFPAGLLAWEPGDKALDDAIKTGDFEGYGAKLTAWLEEKTPADPAKMTEESMTALVQDPVFRKALNHRQFIAKHNVTNLSAFAKVAANREFLAWVMKNNQTLDLYLEAPVPNRNREKNEYRIDIGALERWKQLYTDDPDSREGTYLRLAMAAALTCPGGGGQYRGDDVTDWLGHYKHFKTAHQNKELVPSFDHLLVSDYGAVLGGIGSSIDLAWGRKMIQTWRPDLLEKEQIPPIVSEVWRRFSPIPFTNGFITVMEGGGKCGPRGLFGAFICQAFGIPSIVVGQPAHCCFAARADYPEEEPQGGSVWKVYQGRGWPVSDCGGAMYGPEFVACMTRRYRTVEFSLVEHLYWLASFLSSKERADALRALAVKVQKPVNTSAPYGVPVTQVDVVTSWLYNSKPDETAELDAFEAPQKAGDDFASRVRGFIHPAKSGDYVFAIASSERSELFLSPDDQPGNRQQIARVPEWTMPGKFDTVPEQKSKPVSLEAGKRYYIEVLHRDRKGDDHLSVAWSGPGLDLAVIPGKALSTYPAGTKGKITREVWQKTSNWGKSVEKPEPPFQVPPGVIHVEAEMFTNKSPEVAVFNCYTGGKQVNFFKSINYSFVDYLIDAPADGTYALEVMLAAANRDLVLDVSRGEEKLGTVKIPGTTGLWQKMAPVDIKLNKGPQTIRISAPFQRGIAIRWFELKAK